MNQFSEKRKKELGGNRGRWGMRERGGDRERKKGERERRERGREADPP